MRHLLIAASLAAAAPAFAREEVPLDNFIKHPSFLDVEDLAHRRVPRGDDHADARTPAASSILRRADGTVTGTMKLAAQADRAASFAWVNDERVVLTGRREGRLAVEPAGRRASSMRSNCGRQGRRICWSAARTDRVGLEAAKRKMR